MYYTRVRSPRPLVAGVRCLKEITMRKIVVSFFLVLFVLGAVASFNTRVAKGADKKEIGHVWSCYVEFIKKLGKQVELDGFYPQYRDFKAISDKDTQEAIYRSVQKEMDERSYSKEKYTITLMFQYKKYYYIAIDPGEDTLKMTLNVRSKPELFYFRLMVFDKKMQFVADYEG
jgi:hypothetical protein